MRAIGMRTVNWIGLAARHAGRVLGRLAVLRARVGVDREPQPEHVHADRDGRRLGVPLQRGRHDRAGHVSGRLPHARRRRDLLRHGRRHHGARAARTGARAAGAEPDQLRASKQLLGLAPKTARVVRDGAGSGRADRRRPRRRHPARSARREGAGRRRRRRGAQRGRRIDGHRRADARPRRRRAIA